ncbi:hypothetical protein SAMN04489859_10307 [Paracoccus alcaliphilus]|uniref:DUF1795 domain-containing protein n=1 Tax=Paracoccus alcaliphilus TaxID=34002 RepID=A0A1H8LFC7_9RHOB|nr:DUF1795 domain-containing protein [Paracoccus alcaliphilus]WCR18512.1 DUF1795 domain-containing protein [Paracoccus alcaliphilus]SEO03478.1 hypothetical protein SAMN04489859_10307 [Paracoccus alcaliphilus]
MYLMNECSIELPEGWNDQSINVVSSNSAMAPGLTLTVTRDNLPFGMSFQEYLDEQVEQVSKSMVDFTMMGRQNVRLDGTPVAEIECSWLAKDVRMHQLIYMLPSPDGRAMVITASMPGQMTPGQLAEVRRIVQTLKFRRT